MGTSAEERKLLQKEILGHLWKGDVDAAVAVAAEQREREEQERRRIAAEQAERQRVIIAQQQQIILQQQRINAEHAAQQRAEQQRIDAERREEEAREWRRQSMANVYRNINVFPVVPETRIEHVVDALRPIIGDPTSQSMSRSGRVGDQHNDRTSVTWRSDDVAIRVT